MKHKELILGIIVLTATLTLFFNKTIFKGLVPFPGDLLTSEYQPWKSESYLDYNPGSIPNKAQYPDTIRQLYPWRTLAANIWKTGNLPLWNPYNFSGTPLLANFQAAVFYPFNLLSLVVPQIWTWTILVILQPFLALVFTYFYCRKLKLDIVACWLGAITYAFCAFASVWTEYNTIGQVTLWLPLIFLAIENISEKLTIRWSLILILSIALAIFAGHPQIFFYLLLFSLIYGWIKFTDLRKFSTLILLVLGGIGVASIQLIPGIELISLAARSPHPFEIFFQKILIQPWQLIMMLVPDFFGNPAIRTYWPLDTYIGKVTSVGLVGLIFSLLSLKLFFKDKLIRFFAITSLVVLSLITANPLTALIYHFPLPIISSSSPTLMTFILAFALAILSAFGAEALMKYKFPPRIIRNLLIIFSAIFIILWITMLFLPSVIHADWVKNLSLGKRSLIYETLIFAAAGFLLLTSTKKKLTPAALTLLIVLQTFELFIGFRKFNPFVPQELVFPPTTVFSFLQKQHAIDRFWGHSAASIEANFATQYALFSPDGYDPLYPKHYGEFIQSSKEGKIVTNFTDQTRSDAAIAPSHGDMDFGNNLYRLKILDLLGIKYILDRSENGSTEKGFSPKRFNQVGKLNDWTVYENLKSAPRFFLSNEYKVFTDIHDFENKLSDQSFNPGRTLLLEKNIPVQLTGNSSKDRVKLISYQPNKITFQTESDGPRLLFISDNYYPGWQALIDKQPTEIFRTDYTFRSIIVPNGYHHVSFIYNPKSFTIGLIFSLLSIIVISILLIVKKIKNYV